MPVSRESHRAQRTTSSTQPHKLYPIHLCHPTFYHSHRASAMSSSTQEPSLTFHPKEHAWTNGMPNFEAFVAGAHFSAPSNAEEQREDGGPLYRRASEELDTGAVKLKGRRRTVVRDVVECYCCRPTPEIFHRSWRQNAIVQDPLEECSGYKEYGAQYYGMPHAFSKSRTLHVNVLSSTHGPSEPNRIVYEQQQEYTIRFLRRRQKVQSLITLDLDEDDKIVHLTDEWSASQPPARYSAYFLSRVIARTFRRFISIPKY